MPRMPKTPFGKQFDALEARFENKRLVREIDPAVAEEQLEEAKAELERVERGESEADRWQLEQRIKAAENQLAAAGKS